MRLHACSASLVIAVVLAACGGAAPGSATRMPVDGDPEPTELCEDFVEGDLTDDEELDCLGSGGNGGAGGNGGNGTSEGPPAGGEWTGTLTREYDLVETEGGAGNSSTIEEHYVGTVTFHSIEADFRRWNLVGDAAIVANGLSDYWSTTETPLGTCTRHYTDTRQASDTGDVEGGMSMLGDGEYEFNLTIPGIDGTNDAVRDDSGCFALRDSSTEPWPVAFERVGGTGKFDAGWNSSGSTTLDDTVVSWTLTWHP